MATTGTFGGSLIINLLAYVNLATDYGGTQSADIGNPGPKSIAFAASGGTAPTITGFLRGTVTAAAGDLLLAHATDPFQGMGDAVYSEAFTVAGSKLKCLYLENLDSTNSITIIRGAANGLPIEAAAGDGFTLAPGDVRLIYMKAGTAALSTGSNDKLTVSVSGGSPTMRLVALYGD